MMKKVHLLFGILFFFSCNCDNGKTKDASVETPEVTKEVSDKANEPRTYTMKNQPEGTAAKPAVPAIRPTAKPAAQAKAQAMTNQEEMIANAKAEGISEEDIRRKIIATDAAEKQAPAASASTLPASCQFLSQKFLGKYFKTDAEAIQVKDASSFKTKYVKSCFFKWDNGIIVNSGIFLQIQENPFPDEIPNYASSFIASKKEKGEQMMGDEVLVYDYKDFDAGDEGCYSDEQGKFYWRVGDEHVFMLAFNLGMDKKSEFKYGTDLIREIMKNYNRVTKK